MHPCYCIKNYHLRPNAPFFPSISKHSPNSPDPQILCAPHPSLPTLISMCSGVGSWQQGGARSSLKQRGAAEYPNASPLKDKDYMHFESKAGAIQIGAPSHPIWVWACPSGRQRDVTNALCPSGAGSVGACSCLTQPCPPTHTATSGRGCPSSPPAAPGARVPGPYKESFVWVRNNCSPLYGNMGCVS